MADTSGPLRIGQLRACYTCRILKTEKEFEEVGCPNCRVRNTRRAQYTANFQGMVSILDPSKSWVSKWLGHSTPGYYALAVPKAPPPGEDYPDEHEMQFHDDAPGHGAVGVKQQPADDMDEDEMYATQSKKAFDVENANDDDDDDVIQFSIGGA